MSRKIARETAFKVLFQMDLGKIEKDFAIETMLEELKLSEKNKEYLHLVVDLFEEHQKEIDDLLSSSIEGWTLSRLGSVERNLLRLGATEILFMDEIPDAVAINEAVELAKIYTDIKGASLVNGVLDNIAKKSGVGKHD